MHLLKSLLSFSLFFILTSSLQAATALSIEEKVGQILMVHFHGEIANEEAKTLIQEIKVGGFIYYNWSNGLHSPTQVKNLSLSLQQLAKENDPSIPLFIAIDQEGGRVARLRNGFTSFPANQTVAEKGDPELAKKIALTIGEELSSVGINLNFAPVIDINNNPKNPIIGTRSFGSDPFTVTEFGKKALEGYRESSIIATLKHFPGHGDVVIDSHEALPVIHKSLQELEENELIPFTKLASSTEMIMTAHLLIPALDPDHCTTLSSKSLSYLKETIGFKGVIITDSLAMKGVLGSGQTIDEITIAAFNAGCDILLLGGASLVNSKPEVEFKLNDIKRIYHSLIQAVKNGRISENRLNEAVEKILKLKEKCTPTPLLSIGEVKTKRIAEKVWKNECAGTIEGLTHWNKGENFASLGIGHFIWYSTDKKENFSETFPLLLAFLKKEGAQMPEWLNATSSCPWNSREAFYGNFHSPQMKELRQFLFETKELQMAFIANQLEKMVPLLLAQCSLEQKNQLISHLTNLSKESQGLYALIDYLNFKGAGISPKERYQEKGWGLLQVLLDMPPSSETPLIDFVSTAKNILNQRVNHSPFDRNEKQWLAGWFNRLDSYLLP